MDLEPDITIYAYVSKRQKVVNAVIRYTLVCEREHHFEGWFRDSEAFDAQCVAGQLSCPECDSTDVRKSLMAPSISGGPKADARRASRVRSKFEAIRAHVEEHFDYVGGDFSVEARKIYAGDSDERGIYGEASVHEVKGLLDDGIPVMPLLGRRKSDA